MPGAKVLYCLEERIARKGIKNSRKIAKLF